MRPSAMAPANFKVTVNVTQEKHGTRVQHGVVHDLPDFIWGDPDTFLMVAGMLSYTAEYMADVFSRPLTARYESDLDTTMYAGALDHACSTLDKAVGAALYDLLQVDDDGDGHSYMIDGDLFILEPPAGQNVLTERRFFIVTGVHVVDTRYVAPDHLVQLLGDRHLPEYAMGTLVQRRAA